MLILILCLRFNGLTTHIYTRYHDDLACIAGVASIQTSPSNSNLTGLLCQIQAILCL